MGFRTNRLVQSNKFLGDVVLTLLSFPPPVPPVCHLHLRSPALGPNSSDYGHHNGRLWATAAWD